jgi:hypothetical protein
VEASQLRIDGLRELRKALLALPNDLYREAAVIVNAQAEAAMREMAAAYPVHTGNLRRGLSVELQSGPTSAAARVRNRAQHAYIFESGTGPRRWANGKSTGRMPAGRVFIPIAIQRRRIMLSALIDLCERAGLHVSGAAG